MTWEAHDPDAGRSCGKTSRIEAEIASLRAEVESAHRLKDEMYAELASANSTLIAEVERLEAVVRAAESWGICCGLCGVAYSRVQEALAAYRERGEG